MTIAQKSNWETAEQGWKKKSVWEKDMIGQWGGVNWGGVSGNRDLNLNLNLPYRQLNSWLRKRAWGKRKHGIMRAASLKETWQGVEGRYRGRENCLNWQQTHHSSMLYQCISITWSCISKFGSSNTLVASWQPLENLLWVLSKGKGSNLRGTTMTTKVVFLKAGENHECGRR